jgi:hypothetical protein
MTYVLSYLQQGERRQLPSVALIASRHERAEAIL